MTANASFRMFQRTWIYPLLSKKSTRLISNGNPCWSSSLRCYYYTRIPDQLISTCPCAFYSSSVKSQKKHVVVANNQSKRSEVVDIWKNMTVKDLAIAVKRPIDQVYEAMIYVPNTDMYDSATSQIDDLQVIREIAKKLGLRTKVSSPPCSRGSVSSGTSLIEDLKPRPVVAKYLSPRAPVVAIMGHVDHGKTTLLDALRNTSVAASEAGGITQHIGAFVVQTEQGSITFLDTPGHAAFSALRQRGAKGADLVILVVAADDGVMEQTRESIRMIKEANVPMIVAINKIDKGDADIERSKKMLLQEGVQLEDFGGDVQCVPISASKGTNLSILVEALLVQAELMNLQSENTGPIEGVVLESRVDSGRGKLCTALVQRGVLRKSAILVGGTAWAKVRGMFDEHGNILLKALPSSPVEIIGWRDLPSAGDKIFEVESERIAKSVIEMRKEIYKEEKLKEDAVVIEHKQMEHLKGIFFINRATISRFKPNPISLSIIISHGILTYLNWLNTIIKDYKSMLEAKRKLGRYKVRRVGPRQKEIPDDHTIRHPVIIKGDVDGSVEALLDVLDTYDCHDQCRLEIVHYGVGDISESDVKLAEAFNAHIYGFNVAISDSLKNTCKNLNLEFRISNVIYRLIEAMKLDIGKTLPNIKQEEIMGEANVLAHFKITEGKRKMNVAGSRCIKGQLKRDSFFRVKRGEEIVFDGTVHSMRHLKNEVDTIKNGVECGICFEDETVVPQEGDVVICYQLVEVTQASEWDPGF